jgi:hypothetical protein
MDDGEEVESMECFFNPHYGTVTETGKSHFERVADGLSEFVDNSIQACRDAEGGRNIEIGLYLSGDNGYVVIADNGKGMGPQEVPQFATYSLDRNTRGFVQNDETSISKFGVGAKQAGFFLGSRVRAVTKQSGSDVVHEFILDEELFKERFDNGEDVYKGTIHARKANTFVDSIVPADELNVRKLQQAMAKHEDENDSFTIIVIKLRKSIVVQLQKDESYLLLAEELAEIYHFHLHPEHHPSKICGMKKFQDSSSGHSR